MDKKYRQETRSSRHWVINRKTLYTFSTLKKASLHVNEESSLFVSRRYPMSKYGTCLVHLSLLDNPNSFPVSEKLCGQRNNSVAKSD
jgi:hypothetical protein